MRLSSIAYVDDEPDLREVVQLAERLRTRFVAMDRGLGRQAQRELHDLTQIRLVVHIGNAAQSHGVFRP